MAVRMRGVLAIQRGWHQSRSQRPRSFCTGTGPHPLDKSKGGSGDEIWSIAAAIFSFSSTQAQINRNQDFVVPVFGFFQSVRCPIRWTKVTEALGARLSWYVCASVYNCGLVHTIPVTFSCRHEKHSGIV